MRLLVDSVFATSPGIMRLRDELVRSLLDHTPPHCETLLLTHSHASYNSSNSSKLHVITAKKPKNNWFSRWIWYHKTLPETIKQNQADVVYSLSGILTKGLRESFGLVGTVNNMVPFEANIIGTRSLPSKSWLRNMLLRFIYIRSLKMADAVILHSKHALDTVAEYTGEISSKTIVVLTGVPCDLTFDRLNPPPHPYKKTSYLLYFSTIQPYKNHLRLIQAYRCALDKQGQIPHLLIAGLPADKSYYKKIQQLIRELNLQEKVEYIGVLNRKDIPAWLYHAHINFFPSCCETNSVVLAEMLGCGAIIACSNIPPMPEVVSYAGEFFNPYLIDSMRDVIINLSRNQLRRNELRRLALRRADELSWDA